MRSNQKTCNIPPMPAAIYGWLAAPEREIFSGIVQASDTDKLVDRNGLVLIPGVIHLEELCAEAGTDQTRIRDNKIIPLSDDFNGRCVINNFPIL